MNTDEILGHLVDMEADAGSSAPDGSRFVLAECRWDGESTGDLALSDDPLSLPEALDLLAAKVAEAANPPSQADGDANPILADIRKPERAALARILLGLQPGFAATDEIPTGNPFTDDAVRTLPGARPTVVVIDSLTTGREFTLMILEQAPTGAPTTDELVLLDAAASGDTTGIDAALRAGADVNVLDSDGMTPLHHAVAHRAADAVEALVQAGADPRAQAEFGNSVCFAGLDEQGRVRPRAERIEDNLHGGILVELVAAGADVHARDPLGHTLVDLAIATVPYPDQIVAYLRDQGGRHARRANRVLPELLRDLAPGDFGEQAVRVNEVQYRLEHEDSDVFADTLHWILGPEWTEDEVGAETLFELTHMLLSNGAQDTEMAGWKPLDRAYDLFANGKRPQYQVVTYRMRKAGFTRTLRGMLKWIPDGDEAAQRAHLGEVRQRLETEGPRTDALHWLLAPHGWYENEVAGEMLVEFVDMLLDNGAEDTIVEGRGPLHWAKLWADREGHEQYRAVVERLEAAGFGSAPQGG